jgi:hypothetical protein
MVASFLQQSLLPIIHFAHPVMCFVAIYAQPVVPIFSYPQLCYIPCQLCAEEKQGG